jgi:hypothetical protein
MERRRSVLDLPAGIAVLALTLVAFLASGALAGDVRAVGKVITGDNDDLMYSTDGGVHWEGWPEGEVFDLQTCLWVKANNDSGVLELRCACGWPGCIPPPAGHGCKIIEVSTRPGGQSRVHIPEQNAGWPAGDRQVGATLYDLTDGMLEIHGGESCTGTPEWCLAEQVGFNTPVAQACGQWEEPPGLTSWFVADYDSAPAIARFLNHPESAMPMMSRSMIPPDTFTIIPIFPGEGIIYETVGPMLGAAGVFVRDHPEGLPGEWVPVEFEVLNIGVVESFFDIFVWNNLGWPIMTDTWSVTLGPGELFNVTTEVYIPDGTAPHTVCPVYAKAYAEGDIHTNAARLRVMPDVTIELQPASTVVARGEHLVVTAVLRNNTWLPYTIDGWTTVTLPNHNPFPGNPVAGPQTVPMGPYQQRTKVIQHLVPPNAPLGPYVYVGRIGTYSPRVVLDQDSFGFVIIE